VRYYGWYSNKMRGQRLKQTDAEVVDAPEGDVIDVSAFKPRRIPAKKWRELIKKVWEADPLICPHCQHEMRIVALIDEAAVIERILRHLGLWEAGVRVDAARDPHPENRALDSQRPMWPHPTTEMTASSFKLRANAPEGQKAISYQPAEVGARMGLADIALTEIAQGKVGVAPVIALKL